jgi:GT2 family glycosyltransferase
MTALPYSLVIATYERVEDLARMLQSVTQQSRPPVITIIVDSSRDERSRELVESMRDQLPLRYERAIAPSAAQQRNQGAKLVETPLIAFIDDDAVLYPDTCAKLCQVFDADPDGSIGGVAGRMEGPSRPEPAGLLWWYYRLQAGYRHSTYGGKLFGPAINCYPSYTESTGELIPADWLSSTCVFYRTEAFRAEEFPLFHGYSFMEDVHLSARIGRKHSSSFTARPSSSTMMRRAPGSAISAGSRRAASVISARRARSAEFLRPAL